MYSATPLRRLALLLIAAVALALTPEASAQSELAVAPGNGTLNDAIENDTARPADRVYVLERGGYYGITREINNQGFTLRIKAADGEGVRPVVYSGIDESGNSVASRYFNLASDTYYTGIYFLAINPQGGENATVHALNQPGMRLVVDDCVFQGGRSRLIEINVDDTDLFFTDSQFRNLIRNDGSSNGRPVDYRTVTADTLSFVNTSFLNVSGYLVRYDGPTLNTVIFDHVTVYGTGRELTTNAFATQAINYQFTNNLVVNAYGFGLEPEEDGSFDDDGVVRVDSLDEDINNGFSEADRDIRIENNGFMTSDELQAYYDARTASGDPLSGYLLIDDSANEYAAENPTTVVLNENERYDLTFVDPPDLTDYVAYLNAFRDGAADPGTWTFGSDDLFPADQPPPENLAYNTDSPAYNASVLGFPLGDLNYFPAQKALWEEAISTNVDERPDANGFALVGAYPNPTAGDLALRFDLANPARVGVEVFDALGRRVAEVPVQMMASGAGQGVVVDGQPLSTGVYLARVTAQIGGETSVRTVRFTVAR